MKIVHKKSGKLVEAVIELVEEEDWKIITKDKRFGFKWIKEKNQIVHKIRLSVEKRILGLLSIEDIPRELRIHIRLIEVNSNDVGRQKEYENIAGCLIAFTCKQSFTRNYDGFVSLYSKTELRKLYIAKYGFEELGMNLYTELSNSEELIKKYL